jgi:hypothetical protein
VCDGKKKLVEVLMEDLESYFVKQEYTSFLESVKTNCKRYQKLFCEAADSIELEKSETGLEKESFDDVLDNFRLNNFDKKEGALPPKEILNALRRKLYVLLYSANW